MQRDGFMQTSIHKGEVSYFPNGLQNNQPELVEGKDGGYIDYPEKVNGDKCRKQIASVDDHYSQAQLFWNSLNDYEKQQTVDGFRFEIGKSKSLDVRKRMISVLNHVDNGLARRVAFAVGVDLPEKVVDNPGKTSVGLSIDERPKPNHIRTKRVAILTAPGSDFKDVKTMYDFLTKEGAYVDCVGMALGPMQGVEITATYLTTSSVLYDAVYVADGAEGIKKLMDKQSAFPYEEPMVFLLDAFRHCKPIAAAAAGAALLKASTVEMPEGKGEKNGVIIGDSAASITDAFKKAIMQERFWVRLPLDPPI